LNTDDAKKFLQKQLNGAASSLVLLALLHQQRRPMYGYEIAKELQRQNSGSLPMNPGALYPVLRSLEKQELLSSYSELSDGGRARKYYEVTKTGSETIEHWRAAWQGIKQFIDTILENGNDDSNRKRNRKVSKKSRKSARSGATRS
jgi:PadR family transcriptional regulator PadR